MSYSENYKKSGILAVGHESREEKVQNSGC
jgi:hypothetical protein